MSARSKEQEERAHGSGKMFSPVRTIELYPRFARFDSLFGGKKRGEKREKKGEVEKKKEGKDSICGEIEFYLDLRIHYQFAVASRRLYRIMTPLPTVPFAMTEEGNEARGRAVLSPSPAK